MCKRVIVEDAPGYEDFEGFEVARFRALNGTVFVGVDYEWENRREFGLFPEQYVREANPAAPE